MSLFREQAFVGGRWESAANGQVKQVFNPATGSVIGTIPNLGAAETRRAIEAADKALPDWRARTAKERAQILRKWFDLMMANQEDLAVLMTVEQGKPLFESRGEIAYAASFIEWFAEEGKRAYGDVIPSHGRDKRIVVLKQPIGVTAAITPWNFPAAMITRKVGPALAAGCTMVIKPAELTPYSALAMCVLAERAGIPAGVLSVVTGDSKAIGGELTSNPIVRKLSFTGSTAVGKLLMAQCAATVKKTSMELGGNAPFIVFDDADLEAAVAGAVASKYRNAGQTCVCANRIFVQAGIYDRFAQRLAEVASGLKVGNGLDKDTKLGPLIDEKAVAKVEEHVRDALSKGAKFVVGGKRVDGAGHFYAPTVLTGIRSDMLVMHEETFGPRRAADEVRHRGRSDPPRQRDRVRPRQLFLHSRRRPRVARRRGARKRHRRHQRRHHLDRGRAVRRREGKRHRPRRLEVRPRGISRDQVSLLRRRMKASVRWVQDAMFVGESGSGHAVVMDGAPDAGGRNLGVRPMEMLLLGLGGCTAFDVVMILKRGREPVAGCVVDMDAERAETEPKVFTRIAMRYRVSGRGLDPKKVERAVSLSAEKYCSATAMLAKTAQISHEIEIVDLSQPDSGSGATA